MDGDDAHRQQEADEHHPHQNHPVQSMERFPLQQEPIEQGEDSQNDGDLAFVYEEGKHDYFPFSIRSMSSFSSSTETLSSFTRAEMALMKELSKYLSISPTSERLLYSSLVTFAKY